MKSADAPAASVAIVSVTWAGVLASVKAGPRVWDCETRVVPGGSATVRTTAGASLGPRFLTRAAYVTSFPASAVAGPVIVTVSSDSGATVSLSVACFVPGVSARSAGAVTLAVLLSVPEAVAARRPPPVNATFPPGAMLTDSSRAPEPEAAQDEPVEATHVQVTRERPGKASTTLAPAAWLGPALDATIV